jgi:hypothetical protein
MEDELNKFFGSKYIIASPLFYVNGKWYCMVYFKQEVDTKEYDPKEKYQAHTMPLKDNKPTMLKVSDKQINFLKRLGYKGSFGLTMLEANRLIKELKEKEC